MVNESMAILQQWLLVSRCLSHAAPRSAQRRFVGEVIAKDLHLGVRRLKMCGAPRGACSAFRVRKWLCAVT